jgi:hypothetical protein
MPSTGISHCKANLAIQAELFDSLDQESAYLCAWLRSRLEESLWLIREESALTATEQQRRQVTRLAHKARALGLPVWPSRQRARQEVA